MALLVRHAPFPYSMFRTTPPDPLPHTSPRPMPDAPPHDDPTYEVEFVDTDDLKEHPDNYRTHTEAQIEKIKQSVQEFGIYKNIVTANDLTILAGHGVAKGARAAGREQVPVYRTNLDPSSPRAKQLLVSDNELRRLAESDDEALASLLNAINEDDTTDVTSTGVSDTEYDDLMASISEKGEDELSPREKYLHKIDSPTYEPSQEDPPDLNDLFDADKAYALIEDIKAADLPDHVKHFLRLAAFRHVRFDFEKIAEFYAHADPLLQRLMEASALVIVDFDDAVEQGFANLALDYREMIQEEQSE